MALDSWELEREKDKARDNARNGDMFNISFNTKIAWYQTQEIDDAFQKAKKEKEEGYTSTGYHPWVLALSASLGVFGLLAMGIGATAAIFGFLITFTAGLYFFYFYKDSKKVKPRYSDPARMEQYRKRYKQLTGKDYIDK